MKQYTLILLISVIVFGCNSFQKKSRNSIENGEGGDGFSESPKIAFVIGPGMVRSFAAIGAIRVFEQEKIPINIIVGVEAGALIGALYAASKSSFDVEWNSFKLEKNDYFDFPLFGDARIGRIKKYLENYLKEKEISKFKIAFASLNTDFEKNETIVYRDGYAPDILSKGCIVPGIFKIEKADDRSIVTGQLSNPMPVDIARSMGANFIIAMDVSHNMKYKDSDTKNSILHSMFKLAGQLTSEKLKDADIVIRPGVEKINGDDFSMRKRLIFEGARATQNQMEEIKRKLKEFGKSK